MVGLGPKRKPSRRGSMADVPHDIQQEIKRLEELFTVDTAKLKSITDHFISELAKGLSKEGGSIPDEWSWHMEQGHGNLTTSILTFKELLRQHDIPESGQVNINEYATWSEQVPSGAVWFISQLERENAIGLRGNWAMAGALHDLLAGLVS